MESTLFVAPPVDFTEVAAPPEANDERLGRREFEALSLIKSLAKQPDFNDYIGAMLLRRCEPGRVLCQQTETGNTAFYVLTQEDVLAIREIQVRAIQAVLAARTPESARVTDPTQAPSEGSAETAVAEPLHPEFAQKTSEELVELQSAFAAEIDALRPSMGEPKAVLIAQLLTAEDAERRGRGWLSKVLARVRGSCPSKAKKRPTFIPNDGPRELDGETLTASIREGDLFGEMSCMNRAPRSATVFASQPCYVLEMLRSLLNKIRTDPVRKFLMDETYRKNVLDLHLREFQAFKHLTPEQMQLVRGRVKLQELEPGTILFEEHDEADACYVIRTGMVKVVKNLQCKLRPTEFADSQWNAMWSLFAAGPPKDNRLATVVWGEFPRMQSRLDARLKKLQTDWKAIAAKLPAALQKSVTQTSDAPVDPSKLAGGFDEEQQEIQKAKDRILAAENTLKGLTTWAAQLAAIKQSADLAESSAKTAQAALAVAKTAATTSKTDDSQQAANRAETQAAEASRHSARAKHLFEAALEAIEAAQEVSETQPLDRSIALRFAPVQPAAADADPASAPDQLAGPETVSKALAIGVAEGTRSAQAAAEAAKAAGVAAKQAQAAGEVAAPSGPAATNPAAAPAAGGAAARIAAAKAAAGKPAGPKPAPGAAAVPRAPGGLPSSAGVPAAAPPTPPDCPKNQAIRNAIVDVLNAFIVYGRVHLDSPLGKTRDEIIAAIEDAYVSTEVANHPEEVGGWSEEQSRMFHRLLLEKALSPGIPRRAVTAKRRRTLRYRGRGELIGEKALVANQLRSATCVAFDHPEYDVKKITGTRIGAVASRVEIVRIEKDLFKELEATSTAFKQHVEEIARSHSEDTRAFTSESNRRRPGSDLSAADDPAFSELGLQQGQKLMLIDLDRCTRCGSCVEACVSAHADGRSRLYLDGPRFGNYLVPVTCRQCHDPLCLIGCPVGSIVRGDNGEIEIENWCIGCSMCADQCPYGSIQMDLITPKVSPAAQEQVIRHAGPNAQIKVVEKRAVVCDLCSSLPSQDPACVYACPHDAAMRINASHSYFESERIDGTRA